MTAAGAVRLSVLAAPLSDVLLLFTALLAAYALRFNFTIPHEHLDLLLTVAPFVVAVEYLLMALFGCFRLVRRFFGVMDVPRFVLAFVSSAFIFLALRFLMPFDMRLVYPPISVTLINMVLSGAALLGVRFLSRFISDGRNKPLQNARRVLIAGAGAAGNALAYALRHDIRSSRELCGFVDDSPEAAGTMIQGVPVLGCLDDVADIIAAYGIDEIVVATSGLPGGGLRRLFAAASGTRTRILVAPDYSRVLDGMAHDGDIREADISDLLSRPEVYSASNGEACASFAGMDVLVTGAGGTIGAEISKQLFKSGARSLILVERSENALFNVHRDLSMLTGACRVVPCVADVADESRMRAIFLRHRPQIVIHAASHKHVPMMECNVCEAIANNICATDLLVRLSAEFEVRKFVLLSTEKAACPSSVMGATKRICEIIAGAQSRSGKTRFCTVRFGNVLGASGSVVPIFREQIRKGGPLTITHPEMTRYFMTIPEAAHLILEAASLAVGGDLFVLDMGQPVRIVDLAESMIRLSGRNPGTDIPVVFVGLRPGEQLEEELPSPSEKIEKTSHPRIFRGIISGESAGRIAEIISALKDISASGDEDAARALLMQIAGVFSNG